MQLCLSCPGTPASSHPYAHGLLDSKNSPVVKYRAENFWCLFHPLSSWFFFVLNISIKFHGDYQGRDTVTSLTLSISLTLSVFCDALLALTHLLNLKMSIPTGSKYPEVTYGIPLLLSKVFGIRDWICRSNYGLVIKPWSFFSSYYVLYFKKVSTGNPSKWQLMT